MQHTRPYGARRPLVGRDSVGCRVILRSYAQSVETQIKGSLVDYEKRRKDWEDEYNDLLELDTLRAQLRPFIFNVKHADLTDEPVHRDTGKVPAPGDPTVPKYQWLADQFQTSLPNYPPDPGSISADATSSGAQEWVKVEMEFDVPAGTSIKNVFLDCNFNWDPSGGGMIFHMMGTQFWPVQLSDGGTKVVLTSRLPLTDGPGSSRPFLFGRTGHQKIYSLINDGERIILQLHSLKGSQHRLARPASLCASTRVLPTAHLS